MSTTAERYGEDFGGERMWGLKELPLPDAVSYWPQAPGWYVVAAVLLAFSGWLAWRRLRRWRHDQYRRDALATLDAVTAGRADVAALPFLLRKTALIVSPRDTVASLRGEAWIEWLNRTAGETLFDKTDTIMLDNLAYARAPALDKERAKSLVVAASTWVRKHRAGV